MKSNQFSLRQLLIVVTLIGASIGLAIGSVRWLQERILKIERDAMRQSIVENELDPKSPTSRLDSEYARLLLGDEIDSLRAERQRRLDSSNLK